MHIGKALLLIAGSLRLIWRFRLRSGLILLSAVLGVGGVISAINYAAEGSNESPEAGYNGWGQMCWSLLRS